MTLSAADLINLFDYITLQWDCGILLKEANQLYLLILKCMLKVAEQDNISQGIILLLKVTC